MEKVETKRKVGIWLDKKKALVVTLKNEKEKLKRIDSDLEFFNPKGGARSKTKWGPQDVVQDSKYLEREKHQLKAYFQKIAHKIRKAEAIAIFGPAETYLKLEQFMKEHHPALYDKVVLVSNSDKMTKKQLKARIRDFYNIE